ncbi:MAG: phycobilisome protein [Synechococcaceae cyanobacterium SM2_3_1]|nr:phycobilisome protein [Synechococcaceae cyanobacterium SM2_3_1]
MLTRLRNLSLEADGRYATDAELQLMDAYIQSFELRLQTYLKLQSLEMTVIREVETRLKSMDPQLYMRGTEDYAGKWKADTVRMYRLSALTMLIDDPERLQERVLFWFQTLMRAFRAQRSCDVTYQLLQESVRKHLASAEAELICPILEMNRVILGLD